MDIVICIALKDIYFFNKNLYFIKKNLNPCKIHVITDKKNFKFIKKDKLINLIDENKLIDELSFIAVKECIDNHMTTKHYGWYFQQFLKLGFSLSKFAKEEYLVWDADTVPFNQIYFKKNNKTLILPKKEHHQPYFDTMNNLFEANIKADYSFISEHMLFNTNIVKEMLSNIEKNTGKIWYKACIEAIKRDEPIGFSEFETYGTYCLNYHPGIFELRYLNTFRKCGLIYGIFANINQIQNLGEDLDTGSFEVQHLPKSLIKGSIQWFYYKSCSIIMKLRRKFTYFP